MTCAWIVPLVGGDGRFATLDPSGPQMLCPARSDTGDSAAGGRRGHKCFLALPRLPELRRGLLEGIGEMNASPIAFLTTRPDLEVARFPILLPERSTRIQNPPTPSVRGQPLRDAVAGGDLAGSRLVDERDIFRNS